MFDFVVIAQCIVRVVQLIIVENGILYVLKVCVRVAPDTMPNDDALNLLMFFFNIPCGFFMMFIERLRDL